MYFYLKSSDSLDLFPNNEPYDFIVELPESLFLDDGKWSCNLSNISQPDEGDRLVLIDSLEYSFVHGAYKPVLRRINSPLEDFSIPQWVAVKTAFVKRFHVQILDFKTLKPPSAAPEGSSTQLLIELKRI